MATITRDHINEMHHLYRINMINSISGYKSANLIGTQSVDGISNVAIFSSVTHLGSNPPLLGFFLRPTTVLRNTYSNIKSTKYYTINHVHDAILKDAHHTSAKYDAEISEFDVTSLEEELIGDFRAPYVKGCPVQLGMSYLEEYPIHANNTILVIGEIVEMHIQDELMDKDGFVNLSKGQVATINGLDGYAVPELKIRQGYQRPKLEFINT